MPHKHWLACDELRLSDTKGQPLGPISSPLHLPANGRFSPTSFYVLIHVLNVGQMGRDDCEELKKVAND